MTNENFFEHEKLHKEHNDVSSLRKQMLQKHGLKLGVEKSIVQRDADALEISKQDALDRDDGRGKLVQRILRGAMNSPEFSSAVSEAKSAMNEAKRSIDEADFESASDKVGQAMEISDRGITDNNMPAPEARMNGSHSFSEDLENQIAVGNPSNDYEDTYPMEEESGKPDGQEEELKEDFKDNLPGLYLEGDKDKKKPGTFRGDELNQPVNTVPPAEDAESMRERIIQNWVSMAPENQSEAVQRLARETHRHPTEVYEDIIQTIRGDEQTGIESQNGNPYAIATAKAKEAGYDDFTEGSSGEKMREKIVRGMKKQIAKQYGGKESAAGDIENQVARWGHSTGSSESNWDPEKHHGMTREQVKGLQDQHLKNGYDHFSNNNYKQGMENVKVADHMSRHLMGVAEDEGHETDTYYPWSDEGYDHPWSDEGYYSKTDTMEVEKSDSVKRIRGGAMRINKELMQKYGPEIIKKYGGKVKDEEDPEVEKIAPLLLAGLAGLAGGMLSSQDSVMKQPLGGAYTWDPEKHRKKETSWDPEKHHGMTRQQAAQKRE